MALQSDSYSETISTRTSNSTRSGKPIARKDSGGRRTGRKESVRKVNTRKGNGDKETRSLLFRVGKWLLHSLFALITSGFALIQNKTRSTRASKSTRSERPITRLRLPTWLRESLIRHLPAWVILAMVLLIMLPSLLGAAGALAGRAVNGMFDSIGRLLNIGQPGYIAPLFTPEVDHWADNIRRWAKQFNLDPNLLATIMQIESCGWPDAVSYAGASGLFQVMPFHFATGENQLDPETNATRSAGVLEDCLQWADDDAGLSMACYNGGPSVLTKPYASWSDQTQSYYKWGTGIYSDAQRNASSSSTLNEWLAAGGSSLCSQAAQTLGIKSSP